MNPVTWCSVPSDQFVSACWDDTYVVYHRPSGLTHVLNRAMFELLSGILREPKDCETATRELSHLPGTAIGGAASIHQVTTSLLRLEELGLVRRQ